LQRLDSSTLLRHKLVSISCLCSGLSHDWGTTVPFVRQICKIASRFHDMQ
jgi:hypothetical protein